MPKGGGYFACFNPDMPGFIMVTSSAYQPYVYVKQCPKGHHPEPVGWPAYDTYGCIGD